MFRCMNHQLNMITAIELVCTYLYIPYLSSYNHQHPHPQNVPKSRDFTFPCGTPNPERAPNIASADLKFLTRPV